MHYYNRILIALNCEILFLFDTKLKQTNMTINDIL